MAKTALRLDSFQTRPGVKPFPFSGAYMRGGGWRAGEIEPAYTDSCCDPPLRIHTTATQTKYASEVRLTLY